MTTNYSRFHRQFSIFLVILFLDAGLLGAAAAAGNQATAAAGNRVAAAGKPTYSSFAATGAAALHQVSIQADTGEAQFQTSPAQIALTFDDGPHSVHTKNLLDGLEKRGVKATFFLMGENIEGNEALVQRMQEEGHLIGNHSYRHIQLTKAGEEAVCNAVEQTEEIIAEITGFRPEYLRPPYGDWNESLECQLDLIPVFWSLDSLDWKLQNTAQIVKKVTGKVQSGDIILMHDIFPASVDAALQIIDQLQAEGYTFVTVDELLID